MIALDRDVRARQPVEAHGIGERALDDLLEVLGSIFNEIDPPQQLDTREAGIVGEGSARLGRERDRRGQARRVAWQQPDRGDIAKERTASVFVPAD